MISLILGGLIYFIQLRHLKTTKPKNTEEDKSSEQEKIDDDSYINYETLTAFVESIFCVELYCVFR